ncbi:MAG: Gfo/Idh/MocA family oxidoreductase [Gammaproteobacteria bacterium]
MLAEVDAVSIAVPTAYHYQVARQCLNQGVHILLEKPITQTPDEARELIALAKTRRLVLQVGHLERFNPIIRAVGGKIRAPRFIETIRIAPFSQRSIDIDVLLDLMIHDIDIILSLVQAPIHSIDSVGVPVITDKIDIANVRMRFVNGCVANLTASRVSDKTERKIRVFEEALYLSIDYGKQAAAIYRKQATATGLPLITTEEIAFDKEDVLLHETGAFLDAIRTGQAPAVTGEDGLQALEVAHAIRADIAERAQPGAA